MLFAIANAAGVVSQIQGAMPAYTREINTRQYATFWYHLSWGLAEVRGGEGGGENGFSRGYSYSYGYGPGYGHRRVFLANAVMVNG